MYRPLPTGLKIKDSDIEGQGLFTEIRLPKGLDLGPSHIKLSKRSWIRLPLGGFVNHSDKPNCKFKKANGVRHLKTLRYIKPGEELTVTYKWYKV